MWIRLNISILLWCLPSIFLFGQQPFFKEHLVKDPSYSAPFEIIFQSENRQLFFGSAQGLFFFNGFDFELIKISDSLQASVNALYEDLSGYLWIGLSDGRIFRGKHGKYNEYSFCKPDVIDSPITGFVQDKAGNFWISTYGAGLIRVRNGICHFYDESDEIFGAEIYDMILDDKGSVWLATDGGINICKLEGEELVVNSLTIASGLPDNIVRKMVRDSIGNIWIGTYEGGLCKYDVQLEQLLVPVKDWKLGVIDAITIIENKEVWIGTETNGLWRYLLNEKKLRQINGPDDLEREKIYDLLKDREGNVWVLTNSNGVISANRQFEHLPINLKNPQALLIDRKDNLWIGNQDGLFIYNQNTEIFNPVLQELALNVISLYEDDYGLIWIGTFGEGLILYDPNLKLTKRVQESDGLSNGSILSISGAEGQIWLATLGGVTEIDNSRNLFEQEFFKIYNFDHESGLGTNFIYQVFLDSKDRAWFATDGQGICLLENEEIFCYNQAVIDVDTFSIRNVYSLTEDLKGGIWFSTPKQGIFQLIPGGFKYLNRKAGLRDLAITGLVTDKNGNILVMHADGIDLLDPETQHLIYFDDEVGITDFEPNLNAYDEDLDGDIWIAGSGNLLKYTPMDEDLEIHPMTQITQVSANLELVNFESQSRFDHNENQFVISFSGLWYTDPKIVKYRYRLAGFDDDWIYTKDQEVTYSNLPPGNYLFQVMSTENEVFDNEPIESYQFTVEKPFWMKWWFLFLSGTSILMAGIGIIRYRDERKQRIGQLQKDKIQSQLDAIKSQINPHFLFNSFNTLIAVIEDDPESAVKYVEILSDFYRSLLQYREQDVISLEEEIKLVKDYLFLLKVRYGDNLKMAFDTNGQAGFLAPLTLQILVENAVKHNVISSTKPLEIVISKKGNYIWVMNNKQPKINQEKSTGFGLNSIIEQYQKLSGKVVVVVDDQHKFIVKVPVLSEEGT